MLTFEPVVAGSSFGRLRSSRLAVSSAKQHLLWVLRARDCAHPLAARHIRAFGSRANVLATAGNNQADLGV
jgi:hypothetical protein